MASVGYGDITPTTNREKIYVTLMTVVSGVVFAYTINMMDSIL
jgi:hypothetical protein